eukprot:2005516-Prymnesium_polylepis.1
MRERGEMVRADGNELDAAARSASSSYRVSLAGGPLGRKAQSASVEGPKPRRLISRPASAAELIFKAF